MRPLLFSLAVLLAGLLAGPINGEPPQAAALATCIDFRLQARGELEKIEPAPLADDAEFLRRASLDITGRIPRSAEVHEFLAERAADKRAKLIERLLDDPRFAIHAANVWRAELLPEATTNGQARELERGFENWLRLRFRAGVRYDQLVRELITVPLPPAGQSGEPVLRDPERPNPLAFIAAKNASPENLAAAVTRTFLGIRLECAQCHDHPFAKWSQDQFWSQAAFFGGLKKQTNGLLSPLTERLENREIPSPKTGETAIPAAFLVGQLPDWKDGQSPRIVLADWLTSPANPFFARAAANRVWSQFFGAGLVHPIDDFRDDNPPSDAALLDDLAAALVDSGFDLSHLIRGIALSQAYQRTSRRTHDSQDNTPLPARMPVKVLTGEQFVDSFLLATCDNGEPDRLGGRQQFLSRFALVGSLDEPETSVQQALTLQNGRLVARATDVSQSPVLIAVTQTPFMTRATRIEALYVATLSRRPTESEQARLEQYIAAAGPDRENERLADIFWTLLNCAEFRLNH